MRRLLLMALLALIPASAMAQDIPFLDNVRVRAGYWNLGDLGGTGGVGVDARLNILGAKFLVGAEAADGTTMLGLNATYLIGDMPMPGLGLYYGVGAGMYWVDNDGGDDTTFGAQGVVGIDLKGHLYAEARYCALTDLDASAVGTGDIDGFRFCAGYRWDF